MRYICVAAAIASVACVSCTALPAPTKIDEFGTAVSNGAELLKAAVTTNKSLALRLGEEEQAHKFAIGQEYVLTDKPHVFLNPAKLKPRLDALSALANYGKALKLAADQGVMDNLENASVRLGNAVGTVVTAASPLSAPVAGPALKLVSRTTGYLLGNTYAAEIQAIIVARDPDVKALVELLKTDFVPITTLLERQAGNFETRRKLTLEAFRKDERVDRLQLYNEFKAVRQDVNAQNALVLAAGKYVEVLDALASAHAALAAGNADSDRELKRFVALTNDLVDLLAAASKEGKKK